MVTYHLNILSQAKSARFALFGVLIFVTIVLLEIRRPDFSAEKLLIVFGVVFVMFWSPLVLIHIQYLVKSLRVILGIDMKSDLITIDNKGERSNYQLGDVAYVEFNRAILDKNGIDGKWRWATAWSGYSYMRIRLANGHVFVLTSLMGDLDKFPMQPTRTRFRLFPFIHEGEFNYSVMRSVIKEQRAKKVGEYRLRFQSYHTDRLRQYLTDSRRYEIEAVQAARELLESRSASQPAHQADGFSSEKSNAHT